MNRTKLVTIETSGKIRELGGITGPITTPCKLDMNIIISLINSGKVVYEVNPENKTEKVRLTRSNLSGDNFVKPEPIKKVYQKVETKPETKCSHKNYNKHRENVVKDIDEQPTKLETADSFIMNKNS